MSPVHSGIHSCTTPVSSVAQLIEEHVGNSGSWVRVPNEPLSFQFMVVITKYWKVNMLPEESSSKKHWHAVKSNMCLSKMSFVRMHGIQ